MKLLRENDSFKIIYEKQAVLQEKLGRLSKARSTDRRGKAQMIKEEIFDIQKELGEMIEHLPFKYWKEYTNKEMRDWFSEDQREKCLEEYIDAFRFFINISLILNFTPEEIINKYFYKDKIVNKRQEKGY